MGARTFLLAMATGAGLMYLLDPDAGKRRRARIRDEIEQRVSSSNETRRVADDAQQRELAGARVSARSSRVERNGEQEDEVGPNAAELRDRAAEEEMTAFTENPDSIPSD